MAVNTIPNDAAAAPVKFFMTKKEKYHCHHSGCHQSLSAAASNGKSKSATAATLQAEGDTTFKVAKGKHIMYLFMYNSANTGTLFSKISSIDYHVNARYEAAPVMDANVIILRVIADKFDATKKLIVNTALQRTYHCTSQRHCQVTIFHGQQCNRHKKEDSSQVYPSQCC